MGMMKNMHEFQPGFTFLESSGVNSPRVPRRYTVNQQIKILKI